MSWLIDYFTSDTISSWNVLSSFSLTRFFHTRGGGKVRDQNSPCFTVVVLEQLSISESSNCEGSENVTPSIDEPLEPLIPLWPF